MASLVLIESNGTIKTLKSKEITNEILYKKCGFRVSDDFIKRHTWRVILNDADEPYIISLWAKKTGKANFENKYDFPPPVDKELYFGTCAIVRTNEEGDFIDLTKCEWVKIYDKLFGGIETLGDENEYSEDELEHVDPTMLTPHGYLKDEFVVSDNSIKSVKSKETTKVSIPIQVKPKSKKGLNKKIILEEENITDDMMITELQEETYMFSDED